MDVVAVHVAVIAGVKVRLAIAEEHADLVAVAIGQFGTDEACVVVNIHVDGSAAGVNIAPGTHTGSPQRGTVFEFSALSFTVGVSLILDHATHKSRIHDRGVLSSQMEVVGQRSQRAAELIRRSGQQIAHDSTACRGFNRGTDCRSVAAVAKRSNRLVALLQRRADRVAVNRHFTAVKESVVAVADKFCTFAEFKLANRCGNINGFGLSRPQRRELILAESSCRHSCRAVGLQGLNVDAAVGQSQSRTVFENNVGIVRRFGRTRYRRGNPIVLTSVGHVKALVKLNRCTLLNRHIAGTERFRHAGYRTAVDFRTARIFVDCRHRELAVAALNQLTNIALSFTLFDSSKTLFLILEFPTLFISQGRLSLQFGNTGFKRCLFIGIFNTTQHNCLFGNGVIPLIIHSVHGHVKRAEELAGTVNRLAEVNNTPTVVVFRSTEFALGNAGQKFVRIVELCLACRREHHVANLRDIHVCAVALQKDSHCAGDMRSGVGSATRLTHARFTGRRVDIGTQHIRRSCDTPPLSNTCAIVRIAAFESRTGTGIVLAPTHDHFVAIGINVNTACGNPILFSFWIVVSICCAIVRILELTITVRKDLNQTVLSCDFIGRVHEVLPAVFLGIFHEEEIFFF